MARGVRPQRSGGRVEGAERLPLSALLEQLQVDPGQGLAAHEVRRRLQAHGPNELPQPPRVSVLTLAGQQVASTMTLILLGAAVLSFAVGEWLDGWSILAILLVNVTLGVVQEYRAERAMEAISRMEAPVATVVRDGSLRKVAARELVVGDILVLQPGERVAADARLVEAFALRAEESALTGESHSVWKAAEPAPAPEQISPVDCPHMVYLGTTITSGTGKAVVVRTGQQTQLGDIARLVAQRPSGQTPLQQSLEHLGRVLVAISGAAVAAVFAVGILRGQPWMHMLLVSVSLAVAAIPEGLPAAVTVALAVGVQRLGRRRAIVRRLSAVETLGCTSVICSDKTGTLTRNEMTVQQVWTFWGTARAEGEGFRPAGRLHLAADGGPAAQQAWQLLFQCVALASRGDVQPDRRGRWQAVGDPTEAALACLARKAGMAPAELTRGLDLRAEAPFDPARRRMSVAWAQPGQAAARVVAKGAPDAVLAVCTHGQGAEGPFPLRPWACRQILEQAEAMAREGLRVLAVAARLERCGQLPDARRPVEEVAAALERDMTFLGLLGMYDPPRPEVPQAVLRAKQAGVRTLMVTGDHPQTALAVARRVGLEQQGRAVLGSEIAAVSDEALREMVRHHTIFARVAPAEKRRLVRALKAEGHVVAMTGDGVNDAPALQEADIGVAMGLAGTEVARRAASVVLADDNYATIVEAIEEGRAVYENIRRFIRYLLGCNVGEVLVMLAAGVAGLPVPLLPLQLLWVNLVTDGLPALALGMLPASPRLMRRPPRPRAESLFARGTGEEVAAQGLLSGLSVLLLYSGLIAAGTPLERARTAAFTALVACQLLYALQCAGQAGVGLRRLDFVGAAVLTSALLQLAVLALPPLARVFGTVWPSPQEWLGVGVASVGLVLLRAAIDGAARALLRLWAGEPRRVGVGPGP